MEWTREASRRVALGALLVGVCLVAVDAQQVFRSGANVVLLPVTVTGRGDTLVHGLQKDQFQVLEDGKPQEISYFAVGATPDVPLHLGLLLDTSGSMAKDLPQAMTAVIKFINTLEEARDVTFVDFATRIRTSRFEPPSYPTLFERIRDNQADGWTALYDAVGMYLASVQEQDGQKVLLLYTDGGDSRSELNFGDMIEMLRVSQVMVYVIGYTEHQTGSDRVISQMRMNDVAAQTGGAAFYPSLKGDLDKFYARILDELNARYTIGYVPSDATRDGSWRKVQVKVNAPDVRGVKVRTRPGYYAPVR